MKAFKYFLFLALFAGTMTGKAQSAMPINDKHVMSMDSSKTKGEMVIICRTSVPIHHSDQPLIIVDGKPLAEGKTMQDTGITTEEISSVNVLKGTSATALYGTRGTNGVIIITSKSAVRERYQELLFSVSKRYHRLIDKLENDEEILYVINDKPLSEKQKDQLLKLKTEEIREVKILNPQKTKARYGVEKADGAVVVITR